MIPPFLPCACDYRNGIKIKSDICLASEMISPDRIDVEMDDPPEEFKLRLQGNRGGEERPWDGNGVRFLTYELCELLGLVWTADNNDTLNDTLKNASGYKRVSVRRKGKVAKGWGRGKRFIDRVRSGDAPPGDFNSGKKTTSSRIYELETRFKEIHKLETRIEALEAHITKSGTRREDIPGHLVEMPPEKEGKSDFDLFPKEG